MGFGYLFIGYLITFVLFLTVQAFGVGGLALLVGYGTMMLGLFELTRFNRAFAWAKWLCVPLLVTSLYRLTTDLGTMFLWDSWILGGITATVVAWVQFALTVAFNLAVLYGVRAIALEVELRSIATRAVRNAVFVLLYALVYLFANLVFADNQTARGYLLFSVMLTQVVYILLNLILLIGCTKNICAEGEEDVPRKPHRWGFLNKLDRAYDETRQKNIDSARAAGEALAERRRNKKNRKK
ncbi:MAG: hypothetical protein IJW16_03780 [Clostridia bacterium]|nr:hypothetical protein [Clostridia bacterium]